MKRFIKFMLCFVLLISGLVSFPELVLAQKAAIQSGLALPAGFPADLPFSDDAFNVYGEIQDHSTIILDYQSEKTVVDISTMYRDYIKSLGGNFTENSGQAFAVFSIQTNSFKLSIGASCVSKIASIKITLDYKDSLPDKPVYEGSRHYIPSKLPPVTLTNQSRLKLPALMPKDIPFTKDAQLTMVDDKSHEAAGSQTISITYSSKTNKDSVISLYKAFTRNNAKKNVENSLGNIYTFSSDFEQYKLVIMIINGSQGTTKSQVTLQITPVGGVFQGNYSQTDFSDGKTDSSGINLSKAFPHKRLVTGPRLSDPSYTNIFVRKKDGSLWVYGRELYIDAEPDKYGTMDNIEINKEWAKLDDDAYCLDTEGGNYLVLKSDNTLWSYGTNSDHLLGNGEIVVSKDCPPTKILEDVKTASLGDNGIAVKNDGSLWIWGNKTTIYSVLKNPEKDRLVPEKLMDGVYDAKLSGSVGWTYGGLIMVLKKDGSLWTWGDGNCGDGGLTPSRKTPIKISNAVKAIEASNSLCCFIKKDGSLWAWEAHPTNVKSELTLKKPNKILTGVVDVSAGEGLLAALKTDGTVWTYGNNIYGQCGIGNLAVKYLSSPKKVLDGVSEISVAEYNAFALMKNGKIYGWGQNSATPKGDSHDWLEVGSAKVTKPTYAGFGIN